jgi:hypothetical protein
LKKNYCIKQGYQCNLEPSKIEDHNNEFLYQSDIYELAYYFAVRSNVEYIIDVGVGNDIKLNKFFDLFKVITIECNQEPQIIKRNPKLYRNIQCDLETEFPSFDDEILNKAIIIFSDMIEHLVEPDHILTALAELSYNCKFMLISTPDRVKTSGIGNFGPPTNDSHVREWSIDEFFSLLEQYRFSPVMIGHTANTDLHLWKNTILAISGSDCSLRSDTTVRTLAIINLYNEVDIIAEVIHHILHQGIDVKVIDNWSTDGSYEIITRLSEKNQRVTVERFPEYPSDYYEWQKLLNNLEEIASSSDYDWIIHYDADELRFSPWKQITLSDAISFVDAMGYNAIDFTVIDFRPVKKQKNVETNFGDNLIYFEFGRRPGHFIQIKAWKNLVGIRVNLAESGGHEAEFENRRVFPIKFLNKHYPLRNPKQAKKKIFFDRVDRISPEEKAKGWHMQYNNFQPDDEFLWDTDVLIPWNPNVFDTEFFVERISGLGINRNIQPKA